MWLTEFVVPLRTFACRAAVALAAAFGSAAALGAAAAASTTPPTSEPPTTEPPPFQYADGVLTPADGSFRAAFAAAPSYSSDGDAGSDTFTVSVEEDSQTVIRYPLGGLGAAPDGAPSGRAELFADASGDDLDWLANSATRLGPFPAAYFIVRLTLHDGPRAVVYGTTVVRTEGVTYAFYTDVGGDDGAAAQAFVESYTLLLPAPPAPPASPAPSAPPAPPASEPLTSATAGAAATTPPTNPTVPAGPAGATTSFDGRWSAVFPDGAVPSFAASNETGYAFAEYRVAAGDDVATVRVTEVPAGFEFRPEVVPGFAEPVEPEATTIAGLPAAESAFEVDDSDVTALVVNAGSQIITVTFTDGGAASGAEATAFLDSFTLTAV